MNFALSEEQQTLGDVATQIFSDMVTHERLKELEAAAPGDVFDREVWQQLARAGVLAAAVPEEHGGSGLHIGDLVAVFEAAGRAVAPVPLVPTIALGAIPLVRFGSAHLQAGLLPQVASGDAILTAALESGHISAADGRLTGLVPAVPYGQHAARIAVPAGDAVYVVDPAEPGVSLTVQHLTNQQPMADLHLDGARAELLTDEPRAAEWIRLVGAAAVCAVQAGVCKQALRMTAEHTSNRQQFGKPIAEFQAVAQRAADAFVDAEMVQLTARQALFRLGQGWTADNEVHVAKFWAGDGGMRVVHAAQHLHGGLGVDRDYPLHRYFLWAKANEHTLGTPTRELLRLGAALAEEPV